VAPPWLLAFAEGKLPAINATLNGLAATFILLGWRAQRRGLVVRHSRLMMAAMSCSALFLACYVLRMCLTWTHRFVGTPFLRGLYLTILFSHMTLAVATVPLVLRVAWLAKAGRIANHRPLARWTMPIWLYVSVTGVVIYVMLYHVSG
jgi:putative membrane protein